MGASVGHFTRFVCGLWTTLASFQSRSLFGRITVLLLFFRSISLLRFSVSVVGFGSSRRRRRRRRRRRSRASCWRD